MGNFMSVSLLFRSVAKRDGRDKSNCPPLSKPRQEPAIENLGHGDGVVKDAVSSSGLAKNDGGVPILRQRESDCPLDAGTTSYYRKTEANEHGGYRRLRDIVSEFPLDASFWHVVFHESQRRLTVAT